MWKFCLPFFFIIIVHQFSARFDATFKYEYKDCEFNSERRELYNLKGFSGTIWKNQANITTSGCLLPITNEFIWFNIKLLIPCDCGNSDMVGNDSMIEIRCRSDDSLLISDVLRCNNNSWISGEDTIHKNEELQQLTCTKTENVETKELKLQPPKNINCEKILWNDERGHITHESYGSFVVMKLICNGNRKLTWYCFPGGCVIISDKFLKTLNQVADESNLRLKQKYDYLTKVITGKIIKKTTKKRIEKLSIQKILEVKLKKNLTEMEKINSKYEQILKLNPQHQLCFWVEQIKTINSNSNNSFQVFPKCDSDLVVMPLWAIVFNPSNRTCKTRLTISDKICKTENCSTFDVGAKVKNMSINCSYHSVKYQYACVFNNYVNQAKMIIKKMQQTFFISDNMYFNLEDSTQIDNGNIFKTTLKGAPFSFDPINRVATFYGKDVHILSYIDRKNKKLSNLTKTRPNYEDQCYFVDDTYFISKYENPPHDDYVRSYFCNLPGSSCKNNETDNMILLSFFNVPIIRQDRNTLISGQLIISERHMFILRIGPYNWKDNIPNLQCHISDLEFWKERCKTGNKSSRYPLIYILEY
ncbi:hypothetical protein SNEBB_006496 [Seison nebaliae]|nr:hypothetical protein SNEBB_006496 [Seison nebaliae]